MKFSVALGVKILRMPKLGEFVHCRAFSLFENVSTTELYYRVHKLGEFVHWKKQINFWNHISKQTSDILKKFGGTFQW